MPTIDVHAHCVPEALLETFRREPGRLGVTVSTEDDRLLVAVGDAAPARLRTSLVDVDDRLVAMDEAGIDVQVLSPWMDLAATAVGPEHAVDLARASNDALAEVAATRPERFVALANLPLQDAERAASELRRAVGDLGMVGAEIATRPDDELDDERLDVVWEAAAELDCFVLVHPHRSLRGRGVSRHFLGNLVGNPAETTVAIGHLVFGGVVERHPGVRFCFVHGGGFAPYQVGRWDHAYRQNARGAAARLGRLPSELLRTMWFDTVVHAPEALRHLLDVVGDERVVLGSDHPFEMGDPDPVGSLAAVASRDSATFTRVAGENAQRLLGKHAERLQPR